MNDCGHLKEYIEMKLTGKATRMKKFAAAIGSLTGSSLIPFLIFSSVDSFQMKILPGFFLNRRLPDRPNLFTLYADENNNAGENLDSNGDESDLPAWVRGLRQWPLYPAAPQITDEEEDLMRDALGESLPLPPSEPWPRTPLSNLINVEALLMASGESNMENKTDLSILNLKSQKDAKSDSSIIQKLEGLSNWNNVVMSLQKSISELTATETQASATLGNTTEAILKEATKRLEYLVSEVSTAISPQTVQDLILQAGRNINLNATNDLVEIAERLARDQGLDVREAADIARETTKSTASFVNTANALLAVGYTTERIKQQPLVQKGRVGQGLFDGFSTAKLLGDTDRASVVAKAAEMGTLCGAIYQDTIPVCHQVGHALVANGTTNDVVWMVTDSVAFDETKGKQDDTNLPKLVRVITIRGFDASDENVDREELLVNICTASPELLKDGVLVHSGLLTIAKQIYSDVIGFIENVAPRHEVVLNGHSVGGSLCTLILLLLAEEKGTEFIEQKISRVYTFGSPPVCSIIDDAVSTPTIDIPNGGPLPEASKSISTSNDDSIIYQCDVLEQFNIPANKVYSFLQPWDPIPRLFSEIDPLYPLLGDLGEDGKTLYASGPPRTLRPLTRAIIESWDGWFRFRDRFRATVSQNYTSIGIQHVLLPEPVRYLSDRLVSVNIQVPPIDSVLRLSAKELLPALNSSFPLDVFGISFVPAAIRSFVHHFYPAYGFPIVEFGETKQRKVVPAGIEKSRKEDIEGVEKSQDLSEDNDRNIGSQWLPFRQDR
mmetsp:Transcript_30768/g.46662  ORF Transcript_30768/g.46662 Transcript_30768/m.46662 type:complete len:779 (+) Transcript_30768:208-2544(+)|eukprot:CAMPEP_0178907938 /NCGR_PEP_ID=MMETSP0786-20121207/7645_1 /TAXON_ID=186022 /ORGANISM="Thalassionema frauenfeldii, Strain CCMP 1798" /LENGTH=778 /DNA_ID=CAMNT_0020579785 /DNA_START=172 /DNA_END=2508 /DNA_ORIENTATION=-